MRILITLLSTISNSSRIIVSRLKLKRDNGELASVSHVEAVIRPKDRLAQIQSEIERDLLRSRERDHHWEDAIDVSISTFRLL